MSTQRTIGTGAFLLLAISLFGADLYLTPDGTGAKDGSSWENALDASSLAKTVNGTLKAGDSLHLGGGEYRDVTLKIETGGQPGQPKKLVGVERDGKWPTFVSSWNIDKPDKGEIAIDLASGVSHLQVSHLRLKGYRYGVRAQKDSGAGRKDLAFDDVDMEQFEYGFYLSHCDDLTVGGCDLKRYAKHGFRLEQGCDRVAFSACTADCSEGDAVWETKTELLPFGFNVNDGGDPNTSVSFFDCRSTNNMKTNQKQKYVNGDGFVVEGNARDVTFQRCASIRNNDGGFDLKPPVKLLDCVAFRNKRSFRIWSQGQLENCVAGYDVDCSLWAKEKAQVVATRCTFTDDKQACVRAEAASTVTLTRCLLAMAGEMKNRQPVAGQAKLEKSEVYTPGNGKTDPAFAAKEDWDGRGAGMDSAAYPEHGYRSTAVKTEVVLRAER
jgi:hypothetical protein